jgi:hypothetical protein
MSATLGISRRRVVRFVELDVDALATLDPAENATRDRRRSLTISRQRINAVSPDLCPLERAIAERVRARHETLSTTKPGP